MNQNIEKRIKQINIEDNIWILYIGIILLSFLSNYYEKDYFLKKNLKSKEIYRKMNILIFTTLLIVYAYFEKESLSSLNSTQKNKYTDLTFIGTTAVLISGLIFLYIAIVDTDLEEEIAFN